MPKRTRKRLKQLKAARNNRKSFLGQPGPNKQCYPHINEWTSAPTSLVFCDLQRRVTPTRRKRRKVSYVRLIGCDSSVTARCEQKWLAVANLCSLRSACEALHKHCTRREVQDIANTVGVSSLTLSRITRSALRTGTLMRKPGSGRPSLIKNTGLVNWFKSESEARKGHWTVE